MTKKLVVLFCLMVVLAGNGQTNSGSTASAAICYTIFLAGNKAGFETSSRNPDGSLEFYYEYNDRGRGPKITEHVVLDSQGIPAHLENTGIDYEKAPVDEQFSSTDGNVAWKNRAEQGRQQISAKAFYVSISGAPEEGALLARALLSAGGRLPLLPAGEASIEKRGELKIEANGNSRTVTQYAIAGLDFTPTPIWLDQDGAFFAFISGWFSVIRRGWEPSVDALLEAQDRIANQRSANLARELGHKPAGSLVFVHANLFDTESATLHPNRTVVITGNKITAVGKWRELSTKQEFPS